MKNMATIPIPINRETEKGKVTMSALCDYEQRHIDTCLECRIAWWLWTLIFVWQLLGATLWFPPRAWWYVMCRGTYFRVARTGSDGWRPLSRAYARSNMRYRSRLLGFPTGRDGFEEFSGFSGKKE